MTTTTTRCAYTPFRNGEAFYQPVEEAPADPPVGTATVALIDRIIAFEEGELDEDDTIELFAELVRTGQAWSLQGSYGRMAVRLIDAGYITFDGEVI